MSRRLFVTAVFAALAVFAKAQEASMNGPGFERWVRETFFGGYKTTSFTKQWDIPASANRGHGEIPVVLRTARLGAAIDLGDAFRQYECEEPFLLVIGFWEQAGDSRRLVKITAPTVTPEQWKKLWGPVTYTDLQRFDALINDTGPTVDELRRSALKTKNSPPFNGAIMQVNPLFDDRAQRRLQCALRFNDVFQYLAPDVDPKATSQPELFGIEYPGSAVASPAPAKQN